MENIDTLHQLLWGRLLTLEEIEKQIKDKGIQAADLLKQVESIPAIDTEKNLLSCNRCNNSEPTQFGHLPINEKMGIDKSHHYCLNCIQMGRVVEGDFLYHAKDQNSLADRPGPNHLSWEGTLSPEQSRASIDLIESLQDSNRTHMVHAVTGAGKTEMIFPVINRVLQLNGRVCVASPRIDVCIELYPRIQQAFQGIDATLFYGGSEEPYRYSKLVIATTHQLLRFKEAFDLLIVDEVDAFPYVNDAGLHYATERAVKKQTGKLVYLTATPDNQLTQKVADHTMTSTILPARYHRHPLPEPMFKWIGNWRQQIEKRKKRQLFNLLKGFLSLEGVQLIFMPNIRLAELLYRWLMKEWPEIKLAVVHSKDPDRKEKVQGLRDGIYDALITTTILERGVTFTNCQVCIIGAESKLYSSSALVQMSGRVGRKPDYPTGYLIYAHGGKSQSMVSAQKQIKHMNQLASEGGLIDGYAHN